MTRDNGLLIFPTTQGTTYAIDTDVTDTVDGDGDGFNTSAEWLAGTDPDNANSHPIIHLAEVPGAWELSWDEIPARQYVLQSSPELVTWTDVITRDSTAEATFTHSVPDGGQSHLFFRILIRFSIP